MSQAWSLVNLTSGFCFQLLLSSFNLQLTIFRVLLFETLFKHNHLIFYLIVFDHTCLHLGGSFINANPSIFYVPYCLFTNSLSKTQQSRFLLTSQGVSFTEVLEGLKYVQVRTNCQYSVAQMCTREEYSPAFKWCHESKWAHNTVDCQHLTFFFLHRKSCLLICLILCTVNSPKSLKHSESQMKTR